MLRLRTYLFAFFVLAIIHFAACKVECEEEVPPGFEKTNLSEFEIAVKFIMERLGFIKNNIHDSINSIFGKHKDQSKKKSTLGNVLSRIAEEVRFIFPGTLWCGDGNVAKEETDLGLFNKTDACCRDHDNCMNNIEAGETKVNLNNVGIFTRSACTCDHQFYNCLKEVGSLVSSKIGMTYFDILKPQCFHCPCPMDSCSSDNTDCKDNCFRYQWADNAMFNG